MKYLRLLLIFVLLITLCACGNKMSDAEKFKNEYESLNGKVSKINNKKLKDIKISKKNPIKYSSYDEITNVIKNKTGIIYLGEPDCPWCRAAIPVLLEAAKDYDIDTVYYLNMENERDSYKIKNGKLVYDKDKDGNEIRGTKEYFELLKLLDEKLEDYVIKDKDGRKYSVGEKRIQLPLIIFVNDGEIIGTHTSTVPSHNGVDLLNTNEYDQLNGIYADYIKELVSTYCDKAC